MTLKQINRIARIIKSLKPRKENSADASEFYGANAQWIETVYTFASQLQRENSDFDHAGFVKQCGVK